MEFVICPSSSTGASDCMRLHLPKQTETRGHRKNWIQSGDSFLCSHVPDAGTLQVKEEILLILFFSVEEFKSLRAVKSESHNLFQFWRIYSSRLYIYNNRYVKEREKVVLLVGSFHWKRGQVSIGGGNHWSLTCVCVCVQLHIQGTLPLLPPFLPLSLSLFHNSDR